VTGVSIYTVFHYSRQLY